MSESQEENRAGLSARAQLVPERLSSQISKLILSEIHSGHLKQGDRLPTETALAEKYGVSRTILREAIASLKNDDILESRQGRGLLVKNLSGRQAFRFSDVFETISMEEVNYFYEMRALLESEAASLAAVRKTDLDVCAINKALAEMEKAVASNSIGDTAHFNFNTAIAEASHNPVLIQFLFFLQNKLHDLAKELRIKTMTSPERAKIVLEEHRKAAEGILSGDPAAAKNAVMEHLKNAAKRAGIEICK
ncbi:MAG: FadR/GntR family transcriptional regulator [Synergistaceae bacterium]